MQHFDIYFSGQPLPDASPAEVRSRIGTLFQLQGPALEKLFSGKSVRIKAGVDVDKASRYREAFREAGTLIDIVPQGAPPPQAAQPKPQQAAAGAPDTDDDDMELLPPRTGSLEDCAPQVEPRAIGDTSWMELDAPGVIIDDRPLPPPREFDLEGISMSEAHAFSLEDCVDTRPAKPVPDISHLELTEPEDD